MTGIELLRELAGGIGPCSVWSVTSDEYDNAHGLDVEHKGGQLRDFLADIADQIQREQESLVADSPYDAILPEDRDAIAWVRDHGGLDAVEKRLMPEGMEWPRYEDGEPVRIWDKIEDIEVRSIVFNEGGILFSDCTSVPGWGTWRSYKERVKRPFVPASDGEPLEVGQTVWHVSNGIEFTVVGLPESSEYQAVKLRLDDGAFTGLDPDQLTHQRPVLDADGEPLKEGQTVWSVNDGTEYKVGGIRDTEDVDGDPCKIIECSNDDLHIYRAYFPPEKLTHQRPVLDADGVPIKKGDTVWHIETSREYVVVEPSYGETVVVRLAKYDDAEGEQYAPDQLTHTKPEVDTWQRIEEDAGCTATKYNERRGTIFTTKQQVARDLVRRCRALAERERGE